MNENEKKNETKAKDPRLVAVEEALANFKEKLIDLLYNGEYTLKYINRSITDNHVSWAELYIGGNRVIVNEATGKSGTVDLHFEVGEFPISKELMEAYDRLSIDRDISYYQKQLDKLIARKRELG